MTQLANAIWGVQDFIGGEHEASIEGSQHSFVEPSINAGLELNQNLIINTESHVFPDFQINAIGFDSMEGRMVQQQDYDDILAVRSGHSNVVPYSFDFLLNDHIIANEFGFQSPISDEDRGTSSFPEDVDLRYSADKEHVNVVNPIRCFDVTEKEKRKPNYTWGN